MDQNTNPFESAELNSVTKNELLLVKKYWFLMLLILFISLGFFWLAWHNNIQQVAFLGFIVLAFGFGFLVKKARSQFMKQVGQILGYTYSNAASLTTVSGSLFAIGHSQYISNVLEGTCSTFPLRIYNYQTVVGAGKNKKTYDYTVFEITYPYNLPHLLLNAKEGMFESFSAGNPAIAGGVDLQLEGDFNTYFKVSIEPRLEMEALEILTPDHMEELVQKGKKSNFELSDHKMYVFQHGLVSTKEQMDAMYETVTVMSKALTSHFEEVSDSVAAMREAEVTSRN